MIDASAAENVTTVSQFYFKTIASILDLSKNNPENVIAPYQSEFKSNIFKVQAYGSSKISVRFNSMEEFQQAETKIKKLVAILRNKNRMIQTQFEGGVLRRPMLESSVNTALFNRVKSIASFIDARVIAEHRWSSADICNVDQNIPKIDGLGPIGGFDKQKSEYILRHSLIERALLLALLMGKK